MLGRFEVVSAVQDHAKFRSKSVGSLLAYLSLHPGQEVSRFILEGSLWPESEGDKQAQNLRKAVADLRDVLEEGHARGSIVQTARDLVSIDADKVTSDAHRFWTLAETALKSGEEELLEEAASLYSGPLLNTLSDDWAYAFRLDFEEKFAQVIDMLCGRMASSGRVKDALRIGRTSVLAAPLREDVHITLIRTYRQAGMEAEAIRQFEELERVLDEQWGEPPSPAAREALEGKQESAMQAPQAPSADFDSEPAGGAVPVGSRFYVRRETDELAESSMKHEESVLLLHGPRQVGKSSLLARLLDSARTGGWSVALTDFQALGESQLEEIDKFYKTLAYGIATQVGATFDLQASWNDWLGPNLNLDAVVGKVLSECPHRVCWAIDEADRLFGKSYANDFFGLLRSWHNRKALDPGSPWSKLTLILSYATEAHLFITDLNQSPFNVGVRVPLRDFRQEEVKKLQECYGGVEEGAWKGVSEITNGHPFLTRRAFAFLARGGSVEKLAASAALEDGPFGDHLHRILITVSYDPTMLQEVKRLLVGKPFENPTSLYRLWASGLLKDSTSGQGEFRVKAYQAYLETHLADL